MDGRQPCHLAEPDGTSDLAREQACPGGLCHGHFTSLSIHYWTLLRLGLCFYSLNISQKRERNFHSQSYLFLPFYQSLISFSSIVIE